MINMMFIKHHIANKNNTKNDNDNDIISDNNTQIAKKTLNKIYDQVLMDTFMSENCTECNFKIIRLPGIYDTVNCEKLDDISPGKVINEFKR